ncbi:uncharacterized protein EV420DRAFT_1483693 [Desarmillaria tabescens]|uniref:DUF1365-domain-containing protein n=1 Tax=Armillaria tabescens TaxID=1929756 RepID=A0AA39JSA9_ARMTA|nr:uncharacterized protein EV420DRAFT_1483693 [Desarmillaria tabescens]KAK0447893.1 hypothetical protein EV420DRAFT_1483693 [Desarmillaria tabescens]
MLAVCLAALAYLALPFALVSVYFKPRNAASDAARLGYVLKNQVTHARFLPALSKHAFSYPTVSLLVSLKALESGKLDLGYGLVFRYGGLWGRLTGLRAEPYLSPQVGSESIRDKLNALLTTHEYSEDLLDDVWMMTMPSYLGFEGINPLTVYFCYKAGVFWLTVLEIHNTFGESHVHVLEVGKNEDSCGNRFDHQWTFPRNFHVSPFNDRSGFYTIRIRKPSHPPGKAYTPHAPPLPIVSVDLYTEDASVPAVPGQLKLSATLRAKSAKPLDTRSLLPILLAAPFDLFLSFPRIVYHAWILHYSKRLDVFIKPDPRPVNSERRSVPGGGVKWLGEGIFEAYTRRRLETYLKQKVEEIGVTVRLVPNDQGAPSIVFQPRARGEDCQELTVRYLSGKFFTIMFMAPSAAHAYLLGVRSEGIFTVSSETLFVSVFEPQHQAGRLSGRQCMRRKVVPPSLPLPIPQGHILDVDALGTVVLWVSWRMDELENVLFRSFRARIQPGGEPWYWNQWDRALAVWESGIKRSAVVAYFERRKVGIKTDASATPAGATERPLDSNDLCNSLGTYFGS